MQSWAGTHGLPVGSVSADRLLVTLSGTTAALGSALGTSFQQLPRGRRLVLRLEHRNREPSRIARRLGHRDHGPLGPLACAAAHSASLGRRDAGPEHPDELRTEGTELAVRRNRSADGRGADGLGHRRGRPLTAQARSGAVREPIRPARRHVEPDQRRQSRPATPKATTSGTSTPSTPPVSPRASSRSTCTSAPHSKTQTSSRRSTAG